MYYHGIQYHLRDAARAAGLSTHDLAAATGMPEAIVRFGFEGGVTGSEHGIDHLCKALGIDPKELKAAFPEQ